MRRIANRASRAFAAAIALVLLCISRRTDAQSVDYQRIDRATVRVLSLGSVDVVEVEHDREHYSLAAPIAGHGSGVVVSEGGLIITADHVLASARAVAVLVPGVLGPKPAVVLHRDSTRDFALLRVLGKFEAVAALAPPDRNLRVRQQVYAVGYPLDSTRADPQSTQGVVSGLLPDGIIQLGISVNPGNSGGPMIDEESSVHGIVVSRSNVEAGAIGLAFAVPVSVFRAEVERQAFAPLTREQTARLNDPEQQRLADLVSLMTQYGPEVIRASLAGRSQDHREIEGRLETAANTAVTTADAKLAAAAFYWNRHVVLKVKGDPSWQVAHGRAVKLVHESLRVEPSLRQTSAFVRLLAGESPPEVPAANEVRSPLSLRPGPYVSVEVATIPFQGKRTISERFAVEDFTGFALRGRLAAGAFLSRRIRLGGAFTYANGKADFSCDASASIQYPDCFGAADIMGVPMHLLTLTGDFGVRLLERLSLGFQLGYAEARGDFVIEQSAARGVVGGLELEFAALELARSYFLGVAASAQSAQMHDGQKFIHQQVGLGLRLSYF